jgi:hypothetical protein
MSPLRNKFHNCRHKVNSLPLPLPMAKSSSAPDAKLNKVHKYMTGNPHPGACALG